MKYVALLRGINVGGNNKIRMTDLKTAVEGCGFTNVITYIQSGNVIFETEKENTTIITEQLENIFFQRFNVHIRVVVRSKTQMKKTMDQIPKEWKTNNDLRCYIAYVKEPTLPEDLAREMKPKEGVDFMDIGPGVIYMSTKMEGVTTSGFTKLTGKKIYEDITMRNYNTSQNILSLMEGR